MANNIFQMAKQAMEMRKEVKKIQKELEKLSVEYANSGVKVVACCDMSVKSITIDPEIVDITRMDKLERTITENVGKALKLAKDKSADLMKHMTKDMGLEKLLMNDEG